MQVCNALIFESFDLEVHCWYAGTSPRIQVTFVYEGHRVKVKVKVKVTRAKSVNIIQPPLGLGNSMSATAVTSFRGVSGSQCWQAAAGVCRRTRWDGGPSGGENKPVSYLFAGGLLSTEKQCYWS